MQHDYEMKMKYFIMMFMLIVANNSTFATAKVTRSQNNFNLQQILQKSYDNSPKLQAAKAALAAAKSLRKQSSVMLNPELIYRKESFGGGGAYKFYSPQQNVYGVSQTLEIGGKITARENIADENIKIAQLNQVVTKLDLKRDVTIAYAKIVASQETLELAKQQHQLAKNVLHDANARIAEAASPLIQRSRAEIAIYFADITLAKAQHGLELERKHIAILMAEDNFNLSLDNKYFYDLSEINWDSKQKLLASNPDMLQLENNIAHSKAVVKLEKANAVPNPRLDAGVIEIPVANDKAFMVGVSVPIQLFNSNHDNIKSAQHQVRKTSFEAKQALLDASATLVQAEEAMHDAYIRAEILNDKMLPSAIKTLELAKDGYARGRFLQSEVRDSQRALFDIQLQLVVAMLEFHSNKAQIDRMIVNLTDAKNIAKLDDIKLDDIGSANLE